MMAGNSESPISFLLTDAVPNWWKRNSGTSCMNELLIRDTMATLDRALARIAVSVTGSHAGAEAIITALDRGEATAATRAFLAEGAALIRARLLLADAVYPIFPG